MPIFVRDRTYSKSAPVREANCSIWHALRLLHWHSSPTTSISTNWFERPWWMTTSYFSRDPSIGYTVLEGSMPLSVCMSSNTWSIPGRLCYGSLNILLRGESCIWRRPIWAHPHGSCSETTGPLCHFPSFPSFLSCENCGSFHRMRPSDRLSSFRRGSQRLDREYS